MRNTQTAVAALLLLGGMAAPALADVTAIADISKTETITVNESITITKLATITVVLGGGLVSGPESTLQNTPLLLPGAAEANALANVTDTFNVTGPDFLVGTTGNARNDKATSDIDTSVNSNQGIVQLNQDSGNNSNQGNNVALAFTAVQKSFADAEAGASQDNEHNFASSRGTTSLPFTTSPPPDPASLPASDFNTISIINGSINSNLGIVGVNQNSGNMNNQTNEVAIAIGVNPLLALGEASLGQENTHNFVKAANSVRSDQMTGSVDSNHGIVNVNQSAGNMNNQATTFAIAAAINGDTIVRNVVGSPPSGQ